MFARPYAPYIVTIKTTHTKHELDSKPMLSSRVITKELKKLSPTIHIGRMVFLGIINQKYNLPQPNETIFHHNEYGTWQKKTVDYDTAMKMIKEKTLVVRIRASDIQPVAA